jgi:hypothetical protein
MTQLARRTADETKAFMEGAGVGMKLLLNFIDNMNPALITPEAKVYIKNYADNLNKVANNTVMEVLKNDH